MQKRTYVIGRDHCCSCEDIQTVDGYTLEDKNILADIPAWRQ
jgi:hypothetical protein